MSQHKFPKAYEAYQQAVYRDGRNPTFWCSIGVLYYQINQYRDALDAYSRAIRLNPNISEVWYDLGTLVSTSLLSVRWHEHVLIFYSMNHATTKPVMPSMRTSVQLSSILPTTTSRHACSYYEMANPVLVPTKMVHLLHRMSSLTTIKQLLPHRMDHLHSGERQPRLS